MSSTRNPYKQRLGDDGLEDRLGPPHKRRLTGRPSLGESSTAVAVSASASSVFGGMADSVERAAAMAGDAGSADGGMELEAPHVDRLFSDRVVTVLVGPHETKWCLHENLLSGASDFFKSAFNSGFKESIEGKITMPEDDPQAFELFVRWLYIRTLVPQAVTSATTTANLLFRPTSSGAASCIHDSLRLYVLASKLLIEDLENVCVDIAHAYYGVGMRRPDIKDVQFIYDNTMPNSGMRKLLRERLTLGLFKGRQHNPVTAEWRDIMNETPDLGFDIVSEAASYSWISGGNAPARAISDKCAYHRHDRNEACVILF